MQVASIHTDAGWFKEHPAGLNDSTPARPAMQIQVECYAGYRGEETPRRIQIGDRRIEIVEIIDRWLAPEHRYFKFRTADDARWIIRHDNQTGQWELTFFRNEGA